MYYPHDLIAEITTAMEAYEESEGHTYQVDPDRDEDEATVTVHAPTGETFRFILTCRELDA